MTYIFIGPKKFHEYFEKNYENTIGFDPTWGLRKYIDLVDLLDILFVRSGTHGDIKIVYVKGGEVRSIEDEIYFMVDLLYCWFKEHVLYDDTKIEMVPLCT